MMCVGSPLCRLRGCRLGVIIATIVLLTSCGAKDNIVFTNVKEAVYGVETYNALQKNSPQKFFRTVLQDNPYNIDTPGLIISSTLPTKSEKRSLTQSLRQVPKKSIVQVPLKTSRVIAFSVPLIVIKKSIKAEKKLPFPLTRRISQSQLKSYIREYAQSLPDKDQDNAMWIFPIRPDKSFEGTFVNTQEYKKWMQESIEDFEETQDVFSKQVGDIPLAALLQTDFVAYNYVPSHIFFEQEPQQIQKFEIAILTDNSGKVPAIDTVYLSMTKKSNIDTHKFSRWILKEKNQKKIYSFSRDAQIKYVHTSSFFGRSYSNIADLNMLLVQDSNGWLWKYGPVNTDIVSFVK